MMIKEKTVEIDQLKIKIENSNGLLIEKEKQQ